MTEKPRQEFKPDMLHYTDIWTWCNHV